MDDVGSGDPSPSSTSAAVRRTSGQESDPEESRWPRARHGIDSGGAWSTSGPWLGSRIAATRGRPGKKSSLPEPPRVLIADELR